MGNPSHRGLVRLQLRKGQPGPLVRVSSCNPPLTRCLPTPGFFITIVSRRLDTRVISHIVSNLLCYGRSRGISIHLSTGGRVGRICDLWLLDPCHLLFSRGGVHGVLFPRSATSS